jgi:hypothetical protein
MFNIKIIIILILITGLNICIHPAYAEDSPALATNEEPVTPSSVREYYVFKFNYGNSLYARSEDVSYLRTLTHIPFPNTHSKQDPVHFINSIKPVDLALYSFLGVSGFSGSNSETGQVYGTPVESQEVFISSISNPVWQQNTQEYKKYRADITYTSERNYSYLDIFLKWTYVDACPTDYGMHTDNFCYPYAEKYQDGNPQCNDYAISNDNYIIQGIWESLIPDEILVHLIEYPNTYCLSDVQLITEDGEQETSPKVVRYPERSTSKNGAGEDVQCVDVYYRVSPIGVDKADYDAYPRAYPIANTAPSSIYCDPSHTKDGEESDPRYLDNPVNTKCVDDFDCDGVKDDQDDDIDNDGIKNDVDDDDDNDGIKDTEDSSPWDDDNDNDGYKDGDSRDIDRGDGTNNDVPNDGYVDNEDCDIELNPECQTARPDGTNNCVGDLVDADGDTYCSDTDFDDNDAECWTDSDGDGYCNNNDYDDDNPNCWVDSDGDGVCNDTDVDDNDETKSIDYDAQAIAICDEKYPEQTEENMIDVLNCYFEEKIKLRFEQFTIEMKETGFLATYADSFDSSLKTNVQNENGEITVLESSSSYACPTLSSSSFIFAGETIDLADSINLCDENYNLFYDLMYWFIVSSSLIFILLNVFRR